MEYLHAFLEDLHGIPLDWEIKFSLKGALGTSYSYRTPYRMTPTKLVELKRQLEELL